LTDGLTIESMRQIQPVLVLVVTLGAILLGALLGMRRGLLAVALAGLAVAVVSALGLNPPSAIRHPPSLDPLDPAWMQSLEDLPVRVAESAAERAAATRALEQVAEELQGHRQTTRVLAAAIRRLPDIATHHAELTRETNQILERQSAALESMLDGLAALRAAFNTVEESSRRHLKAIALLESSHRQILFEYQTMFLRSHRLVGYVAAVAVILAGTALGGLAYVAYMVFLAA